MQREIMIHLKTVLHVSVQPMFRRIATDTGTRVNINIFPRNLIEVYSFKFDTIRNDELPRSTEQCK